ncbi:MAG: hypothetical protein AAFW46_15550 [Pseudomonadota bacterium]
MIKEYELLTRESQEIHDRTDKTEQFFILAIGGIYALILSEDLSFSNFILLVPPALALFTFARLELLADVRRIIRSSQKQIEVEMLGEDGGAATHFEREFYGAPDAKPGQSIVARLFAADVSDRARFWRILFFASIVFSSVIFVGSLWESASTSPEGA